MTTWFITRHPGARDWAEQQKLAINRYSTHLDPAEIAAGDTVIGSLPVHLAAAVCAAGARYYNLSIDLPADARGKELSAEELSLFKARLEEFRVGSITPAHPITDR
jgi:CRISPR-associated protein Csx16